MFYFYVRNCGTDPRHILIFLSSPGYNPISKFRIDTETTQGTSHSNGIARLRNCPTCIPRRGQLLGYDETYASENRDLSYLKSEIIIFANQHF